MWEDIYTDLKTKIESNTQPLSGSVTYGDKTITWRSYSDLIKMAEYCKQQAAIEAGAYSRRVYARQVNKYAT